MVVRSYAGRQQEFANRRKGPKARRYHGGGIMDGGVAKSLDGSMVARSWTGESQKFMDGQITGVCQRGRPKGLSAA
jgi:hypothetical protein